MVVSTAVGFVGPNGPMEVQLPPIPLLQDNRIETTEFASAPGHAGRYQVSVRVDLVGPDGRRYPVAGLATSFPPGRRTVTFGVPAADSPALPGPGSNPATPLPHRREAPRRLAGSVSRGCFTAQPS